MTTDRWDRELREQLSFHWETQLRPRLEGLSDDEYFWEPVPGCWNIRPRGTGSAPIQVGGGDFTIDFAFPEPDPPPLTTIAWRLGHVIVGVLAARNAAHFRGPPTTYEGFDYAGTADAALAQLDEHYAAWQAGVASLGDDGLDRPVGEAEGAHADYAYSVLVLQIRREMIHHLAEVCLLRDVYAHTPADQR